MEFEEIQKIWNEQKGETMYAINESTLHERIKSKKQAAGRRINKVEIGISVINSFCAIFLFIDALNDVQKWDFVGSAIFLSTVIYIQYSRYKRKKAEATFDRSMIGELDHAIANTESIIKVTQLMILGYLLPISILYLSKLAISGASPNQWLLITGMFALAFILIYAERKKMHLPRVRKLKRLRDQLMQ
jgi:Ca2+/Na+ antiporter